MKVLIVADLSFVKVKHTSIVPLSPLYFMVIMSVTPQLAFDIFLFAVSGDFSDETEPLIFGMPNSVE